MKFLQEKLLGTGIFEDIINDNQEESRTPCISDNDEILDNTNLFKVPKYLETVF